MLRSLAALAALVGLNAWLVIGDFYEDPLALVPAQVSLEVLVLLGVFALLAARGRHLPGWAAWTLGALVLLAGTLRFVDILVPWYFGRYFNITVDLRFLPVFAAMLRDSMSGIGFAALAAGLAAGLLGAVGLCRMAVGGAWLAVAERRPFPFAAALLSVVAGWAAVHAARPGEGPVVAKAADVVGRSADQVLNARGIRSDHRARIENAVAARPDPGRLSGLDGRNVLLVFVESYGNIVFRHAPFAEGAGAALRRMEGSLGAAGYRMRTGRLESPITGGGSWLAHATLTSGARIGDQVAHDVLLAGETPMLGGLFRNAGYRAVAVMPRMQQPWPESVFFGFESVYDDRALGYRGRRFSWETVPDQWVLEQVHRREIADASKPLFLQYVLSSSHAPFDAIPPVVPDARALGDGSGYSALPVEEHPLVGGRVFEQREGYIASIRYVLGALERYLVDRLDDHSLVVILGDHQPPLSIVAPTRDRSVPIHILSRDPAVVERFRLAGTVDGLFPDQDASPAAMEAFLNAFLSSYGKPGRQ